jgi:ribose/xylose/arabinose/galactoside ABC-type transport system permease subunit
MLDFLKKAAILWVLIIMCIVIGILSPNFIKPLNVVTVFKQISMLGIVAMGSTFVLISGGIDLSVGSIMSVAGVCAALAALKEQNNPLVVPILLGLLVGFGVGFLNGFGITYGKITPFIMTLGFMITMRGLALLLSRGRPIFGLSERFADISGAPILRLGTVSIPNLILYLIGTSIIMGIVLRYTVYGKWLYAVGGNENSARFSAINVNMVKMVVYTLNGLLAGLCGVLMASRINSGDATVAENFALDAIAASVIGGVSLSGGAGTIWKTLIGALIIGVMQNGLQILGVSPFIQTIVQGLIIILAVFSDTRSKAARS